MALDHGAAALALRNRAATLSVAPTGSVSISATPTGYARAAGSFLTDGILPGMEITPSGFSNATNNLRTIAVFVSATVITTLDARITEAAGSRTISVGLPENISYENAYVDGEPFEPTAGRWYLEEDYVRGPRTAESFPLTYASLRETGMYALNWYFLPGYGSAAIHACVDALLELFKPGTELSVGDDTVVISGNPGPSATQPEPDGEGWTVVSIEVPWFALTSNVTA